MASASAWPPPLRPLSTPVVVAVAAVRGVAKSREPVFRGIGKSERQRASNTRRGQ